MTTAEEKDGCSKRKDRMGSQRAKPLLAAWGSREHRCCFVHEEFKFNRVAGRATTRVLQARSADGGGKLSSDVENGKIVMFLLFLE